MARVEWTRIDPNDIEAVVAILLCREYIHAVRVMPSQGDGGIDVLVRIDDGLAVYQVKGFFDNIDSGKKGQIRKSWKRFLDYQPNLNLPVARWQLAMPRNPTKEQLGWFGKLTSSVPFPCFWLGLDFLDGLAAKYPDVIDYYLRDGKDRLAAMTQTYLGLIGSPELADPVGFEKRLSDIHTALNATDPHYSYDFAVEAVTPDRPPRDVSQERGQGLVAVAQTVGSNQSVTFWIYAKFDEALKERPVPGSFVLQAETGSAEALMIEDWIKFGTPLVNIPAINVEVDLPGGFGRSAPSKSLLSVSPASHVVPPVELTIRVLDPDGTVASQLDFGTVESSQGLDGRGIRAVGRDVVTGTVSYELRARVGERTQTVTLSSSPVTGMAPRAALEVTKFVGSIVPPRRIQLALRDGPVFGPPSDVSKPLADPPGIEYVIDLLGDLVTIQQQTFERILVPDLSKCKMDELLTWSEVAKLLRGEVLEYTWREFRFCLHQGAAAPDGARVGLLTQPLTVEIDGHVLSLGWTILDLGMMQVDPSRPPFAHDDHLDCWIIPAGGGTVRRRFVGKEEPKPGSSSESVGTPPSLSVAKA